MAKKSQPEIKNPQDLINSFLADSSKRTTTRHGYMAGDHAKHTWGLPIPHLAFQWLIGGSNVLPLQRFLGISGEKKSFKSTLVAAISNWFLEPYGIDGPPGYHLARDTEDKTSPSMLTAIARGGLRDPSLAATHRNFLAVQYMEDWMEDITDLVVKSRQVGTLPSDSVFPVIGSVDSIMGKGTREQAEAVQDAGHAQARQFPTGHAMVTNYLDTMSLHGCPTLLCWVQHMKENINAATPMKTYREKGPSAAAFASSIHIRVKKGKPIKVVNHPAQILDGPDCRGYTLTLETALSCVGPDKNKLEVDLIWQFEDQFNEETGQVEPVQYMKYDWEGALGNLLISMKYGAKKASAYELSRLTDPTEHPHTALEFTGASGKDIKCPELELDGVDATAFGRAIEANPEVRKRISGLLRIQQYPTYKEIPLNA